MQAVNQEWDISDYSKQIRAAAEFLRTEHGLTIPAATTPQTEYDCLRVCRKHWAKLRAGGIELVKVKDYPSIIQVEATGLDHWRCTNHTKGTCYEIKRDDRDQFNCSCPANVHGSFCSHMESLFASPVYETNLGAGVTVESPEKVDMEPELVPQSPGVIHPSIELDPPKRKELVLPNGLTASEDQAAAFDAVLDWFTNTVEPFYLISGYAGTGKTTLQQLIIERLPVDRFVVVAPSNKAVKVASSKLQPVPGKTIDRMTVAKLLAIKPSRDSAKQSFERDWNKDPLVSQYPVVIFDECSMENKSSHGLLKAELQMLLNRGIRCIYMGDPAQLPPVLEDVAPCFSEVEHQSKLTHVIRNDGAVLEWSTQLRDNLGSARILLPKTSFEPDKSKGLWVLPRDEWESTMHRAFIAARDKGRPANSVRALAWTNKRVDQINSRIRAALNPVATQFEEGDRLIVKAPFQINLFNEDAWLQTADELTVIRGGVSGESQGVKIWNVLVETEDGLKFQVPIIKMSGRSTYELRRKELRESKRFGEYWDFTESFCDVAHAYGLTVHNSQGSTFDDVFIDGKDICKCPERTSQGTWLRLHLLYVAASRASRRVFITFE